MVCVPGEAACRRTRKNVPDPVMLVVPAEAIVSTPPLTLWVGVPQLKPRSPLLCTMETNVQFGGSAMLNW